ncbi:hypothetical protein ACOBQX_28875 [Actinokineospora sp. G85]|uniref:hypothetical protein n=1 Tax=Actinokineospora sp. G85 TaxID=3406626 RepID=UPI003C72FACE
MLDSALEVLRAQAGNDRLVMVISHLRAVAEAVDEVLWVERTATGNAGRDRGTVDHGGFHDQLTESDLRKREHWLARYGLDETVVEQPSRMVDHRSEEPDPLLAGLTVTDRNVTERARRTMSWLRDLA